MLGTQLLLRPLYSRDDLRVS
eukprot:COSAG04_NODE_25932_length_301_cov_1.277228_1_plen_20_part_01